MSSIRYVKVFPAPYDGQAGVHYNKECPVELFRATARQGRINFASIKYSKVYPAPYDGPVGAHYNRKCPVELFQVAKVPSQNKQTYKSKQDVGKGEGNLCAMPQEVKTDLEVNNFLLEAGESENGVTNDIRKIGIIGRLGKSVRGLRSRLAGKGKLKIK